MPDTPARPPIGNFRSKPDNAPRKDPPPAPEAAAPSSPDETPPAPKDEATMTPKERYEKRLADAGIARETANAIFDAVMTSDFYEEYVSVGQHRATLRTRLYDDHLRLQTALEMTRPGLVISQEDMINRYNLAASLYEWKGKTLKHDSDEDFDKILTLLKKMPAPVYSLLVQRLAAFDQKVLIIFSEGAVDSF